MHDNNNYHYFSEVLESILLFQQRPTSEENLPGCTEPFLGNKKRPYYNTRPVSLECCYTNKTWQFPVTVNGTVVNCNLFRIENVNNYCATFRCLAYNSNTELSNTQNLIATKDFFTIDLNCVATLTCHKDINILGI